MPNNGINRTESLSNSAGSAALAALRLHQNSTPQQTKPPQPPKIGRNNSLSQRSNSLKTYTYHPKGSYTPGQAAIPNARRFSSLNSNSNNHLQDIQNNYLRPPKKISSNRHSSLNSNNSRNSNLYQEQDHFEDEDDGETIITTQTTKVVDSQGRVQSITTKTIKTLPDGSNIIETTTKNISRSNSLRNNSLRTNSFRNNSLTSSPQDYNLHKIDEDLQDFEYNYELDNELPLNHPDHLELNRDDVNLSVDSNNNSNISSNATPQLHSPLNSPKISTANLQTSPNLGSSSLNASPKLNSNTQISPDKKDKPLKSILKSPKPVEGGDDIEIGSIHSSPNHPYKTIGNPLSDPPKFKVPQIPKKTSPVRERDITSNASATSASSIKFSDNVETIPIYHYEKPQVSNQELYDKAMKVAMQKVYGAKKDETTLAPSPEIESVPRKVVDKKDKQDKKLQVLGHSGVNDNYIYENHHKDFKIHSMRDDKDSKASSRKERAKLEKKQRKDYEKQLKEDEKRRKEEEKRKLNETKNKKKSPIRGLFSRRKKDDETVSINHSLSDGVLDGSPRRQVSDNANDSIVGELDEVPVVHKNGNSKVVESEEVIYEKVDPLDEAVGEVALEAATAVTTDQPQDSDEVLNKRYSEVPSMPTPQIRQEQTFDSPQAFIRPRPLPRGDLESLPSPNLMTNFESQPLDAKDDGVKDSTVIKKSSSEFKQPDILTGQTSKSNISKPEVSPIIIGNSPQFESFEKNTEIPRPLLNDISTDVDTDLDEYEDVLGSPGSVSRKVSRSNSVKSPKEIVVEEESRVPVEQPIVEESNGDDGDGDDDTILNKEDKNVHTFANFNNDIIGTKEPQTLSDLIKLGRTEDTDDSFQPPNAYDSDSDVSSKFSADLSAAIRRISDYPNEDGEHGVEDDWDNENIHNENREAFVIDEPLTVSDKNVKIYEPVGQTTNQDVEASSAFASPTEGTFPKKNDSAPLTESSDDRSPQPSRSTLATNDKGVNNDIPGVVVDKHGVFTNKPKKAKKSFGKKILKLFVNSYEQNQK